MKKIIINKNDANQRLDKFITKFMPALPKGMLYKSLRKNCVRVNGKHIKNGDFILHEGDILSLYFKDEFFTSRNILKTDEKLNIIYEDENIMLIDKAAGTVVHADDNGTENTLIDSIKWYLYQKGEFNPQTEHSFSPSLCNRLDRNTGGIIIAAKNAATLRAVNEKIRERKIKKYYLCIVDGHMDKKEMLLNAYLTRQNKKVSVSDTPAENSKPIKTRFKVIGENDSSSLLEIELLTGRTHQIRAQLAHIGHPLSGDKKYGSKSGGRYHQLYSYKLIFSFEPDGGILDYLSEKEFTVSVDFSNKFFSQKS